MHGTNLDQVGPNMAKLDQLGHVGRHFAVLFLSWKSTFDQLGPSWSSTLSHSILCTPEIQRQRCIKFRVLRAQDSYAQLALHCRKGQHLPSLEVYKNQLPTLTQNNCLRKDVLIYQFFLILEKNTNFTRKFP